MRTFFRRAFYSTVESGSAFEKRVFLLDANKNKISIWNDVPLRPVGESDPAIFNAAIEIPRYSLSKLEVRKNEQYHPIVQDVRKNRINKEKTELRYYAQYGFFNYGFFPQTWENSIVPNTEVDNLLGDDDPLDLIEVSDSIFECGTVVPVRVLGVFALIDQGELDWKIVCLNEKESQEKKIKTIDDLEQHYPHRMKEIVRWFKNYKTFDGKGVNKIHFDDAVLEQQRAIHVIEENHGFWKELREAGKKSGQTTDANTQKLAEIAKKFFMNN